MNFTVLLAHSFYALRIGFWRRLSRGFSVAMAVCLIIAAATFLDPASLVANGASVKLAPAPNLSASDNTASASAPAMLQHKVMDAFDGNNGRLALPRTRPDYLATLGGITVSIETPTTRPSITDFLPQATANIEQMVRREAGQRISKIFDLTLSSGETLAKLLKRACLLYTSPSPRDVEESRMPSSA